MTRVRVLFYAILAMAGPIVASAQGVPTFDAGLFLQRQKIITQTDQDLALQNQRLTKEQELATLRQDQLAALQNIQTTLRASDDVAPMINALEAQQDPSASSDSLFGTVDANPAAQMVFGDAAGSVETLIIRAAKDTHGLSGVSAAGLSVVQWRCLLQALIWQESRFTIGARSPVGAFGLTQIMPGTAQDLGIYPSYYDSPYIQVTGGARYLAQMLGMFGGNIIHALAAYNAGPGNVQKYSGVPPFKETQHYVQVIPERYNLYLSRVGGIDALGTIDPMLLANSSMSLAAHSSGIYGDYSMISVRAAAGRVGDIIERIETTTSIHDALSLNTYARAELARLMAIRTRLKAVQTKPMGAAELAMAAAQAREQNFIQFHIERVP